MEPKDSAEIHSGPKMGIFFVGAAVMIVDVLFVVWVLVLDHTQHEPIPTTTNPASPIGWVGTIGAIVAFGSYGVLIKTPALQALRVDTMIFQVYSSSGVALGSALIWVLATHDHNFEISVWGLVFSLLWVLCQVTAYQAIQFLGYAVGPAVWAGLTIVVSFLWGVAAFGDSVTSVVGSLFALLFLVCGIYVVAASRSSLPEQLHDKFEGNSKRTTVPDSPSVFPEDEKTPLLKPANNKPADTQSQTSRLFDGIVMACVTGLLEGSLMVPLRCYSSGCLGYSGYVGEDNPSVAFLPSLSVGIALVTPLVFMLYFRFSFPETMHSSVATIPGILTGCFSACGNFCALWSTLYLGQTIGLPLIQTHVLVSGLWGILYFEEIRGKYAIGLFGVGVGVMLLGATLDGLYA